MNSMLSILLQSLGAVSIIAGVLFSGLGVLGILRLPDTYSRLHASGKTSTLGILFICLGTACIIPAAFLKILALAIFIIFSGPVGSHAIAAAVHRGMAVQNREAMLDSDEFLAIKPHSPEPLIGVLSEAAD
jgi:multicomponent Na+:H+ antiporter subunit G